MATGKKTDRVNPIEALNGMLVMLGWMQQLVRDVLQELGSKGETAPSPGRRRKPATGRTKRS